MQYLAGKTAVITGSSMGIGKAVALEYARQGARLVINSASSGDALQATAVEIRALGGEVLACLGSVADYGFATGLIDTCENAYGSIDILVNVAGIAEPHGSSILNIDPQDWQRLIDVHLTGTFNTCRAAAPRMVEQRRGSIVNTSSHSLLGVYGGTGYPAAKAGVLGLTWSIAQDLKAEGVRCNAVCPGAKSRLSSGPDYEATIKSLNARRILDDAMAAASLNPAPAKYLAPLYALLGSDLADEISGKVFSAYGGYVGVFNRPQEQFAAYKDHEQDLLWDLQELAGELHRYEITPA